MNRGRALALLGVGAALALGAGRARAEGCYRIDLAERARHRLGVELSTRAELSPLELRMPVWTPGAYELRDWGRNVKPVEARDEEGHPLRFERTGPSSFRVSGHARGARIVLRYQVYAARLSDDGSHVDRSHALLNGTSLFLLPDRGEQGRYCVRVAVPEGWRAATTLATDPEGAWVAPSYEALVDAPIELGRFAEQQIEAAGRSYQIVIDGASKVPPALLRDLADLAAAEARLVGPPPYARYLLILHLSDIGGRMVALEHAASASVILPRLPERGEAYRDLLHLIAHELFHAWNARRLRPAELHPYDFHHPRPARSLWITEGLTEYYAHRALRLAGRWSRARYLEQLGHEATRAARAARAGLSLEEAAELAWHPPDELAADPDAYYAQGHLVALALDAAIRATTRGARSLDDVVRELLVAADRAGGVLGLDSRGLARAIAAVAGEGPARLVEKLAQGRFDPAALDQALRVIGLRLVVAKGPARSPVAAQATALDYRLEELAGSPELTALRRSWLGP